MQFELQTHEVMEPVGQRTGRGTNVYSLVPVYFVCKTSKVYRDASQSVNRRWEAAVSSPSVSVFIWLLARSLCVLTWKIISSMKLWKVFAKYWVPFLKETFWKTSVGCKCWGSKWKWSLNGLLYLIFWTVYPKLQSWIDFRFWQTCMLFVRCIAFAVVVS